MTISRCQSGGLIQLYKNKAPLGKCNISGSTIKMLRLNMPEKPSQRAFADLLQLHGLDLDKNAVQRIESGKRFVTDIELKTIASVFNVSVDYLLNQDNE